MRRSGFTLAELMVSLSIGVVIFGAALLIWNFSNRSRGVTATARALQTALFIEEQLCADLGRLVQAGESALHCPQGKTPRLSFYALDARAATGLVLPVRGITYALDGAPGLLTRECDRAVESLGSSPLTSVAFNAFQGAAGPLLRVTLTVGREPGEPPGPPTVHSFLARIPVAPPAEGLEIKVLSPFSRPEDEPPADDLPDL